VPSNPHSSSEPPIIEVDVVSDVPGENLSADDLTDLRRARSLLTSPGVAVRFANLLGTPIEELIKHLPSRATRIIQGVSQRALRQALHVALFSLGSDDRLQPDNRWHKILAGASGAVGGAFGLPALAVELPVSTTLILRSIAQIAASEGHSPDHLETRLACLEVFALSGDHRGDNATETSYWAVRAALSKVVTDTVGILAARGSVAETTPTAIRFVAALAARFGVVVSEQVAAKAIPVLGAAAGAAINVVFMDHFQKMAQGHFIVRRLERRLGTDHVRRAYESLGSTRLS